MVAGFSPFLGAAAFTLATVTLLAYPFETRRIPRDAVLGAVFILAAGLSILVVAKSGFGLVEVRAVLYGDLILTSRSDVRVILASLVPVLVAVVFGGLVSSLALTLVILPVLYTLVNGLDAQKQEP